MPATTATKWLGFFKDAGIPECRAATYANNFAKHRMDMTMLGEVTKEVLKELDITGMGDCITIMRHVKIVVEKQQGDRVIAASRGKRACGGAADINIYP